MTFNKKIFKYQNFPKKTLGGFTLIELMVSVGIFIIVIVIMLGLLLSTRDSLIKTRALRVAVENISVILDSMAKDIRVGTNYYCLSGFPGSEPTFPGSFNQDCVGGGSQFVYIKQDPNSGANSQVSYVWDESELNIKKGVSDSTLVPSDYKTITSPDIKITSLKFYVSGSSKADSLQPFVTITVSGFVDIPGKEKLNTTFKVQTSVSYILEIDK